MYVSYLVRIEKDLEYNEAFSELFGASKSAKHATYDLNTRASSWLELLSADRIASVL